MPWGMPEAWTLQYLSPSPRTGPFSRKPPQVMHSPPSQLGPQVTLRGMSFSQAFGPVFIISFFSFSPPHPTLYFSLHLVHLNDKCLEWGLVAGLRGFASHGGGAGWLQWKPLDTPESPTSHFNEAAGLG